MLVFREKGFDHYVYWQTEDRKILKKINALLRDIDREPYEGLGKPEPLKYTYQGCWSRRIDDVHRLVYEVEEDKIIVYACHSHYDN
jgi:toxin YoeB